MPKVLITPQLAELLRTMRVEHKITSKDISQLIHRTPSYVTKLEGCGIKTIEQDELLSVFRFIAGSEEDYNILIDEIYKTLKFKFTLEEIEQQDWFNTFDTVIRTIPLPLELVSRLNDLFMVANVSVEDLCRRINNNESIPPDDLVDAPVNQWVSRVKDDKLKSSIRLDVSDIKIRNILDSKVSTSNYITIKAMAFYLFKIQKFGSQALITEEDENALLNNATELLNSYKFYSLSDKARLKRNVKTAEEFNNLLTEFDTKNIESTENLLNVLKIYSDFNVKLATEQLQEFTHNLEWDAPFVMNICSLPFFSLDKTSYTVKKKLLHDIKEVLNNVLDTPADIRNIEEY